MGHSIFGATLIIVGFIILLNTGVTSSVNILGLVVPTYVMQWTGLILIILGVGLWLSMGFTFRISGTRK